MNEIKNIVKKHYLAENNIIQIGSRFEILLDRLSLQNNSSIMDKRQKYREYLTNKNIENKIKFDLVADFSDELAEFSETLQQKYQSKLDIIIESLQSFNKYFASDYNAQIDKKVEELKIKFDKKL